MFFRRKSSGVNWVIAGLGNPGKKYENTRHNVGFAALDHAARAWGIDVGKSRFDALSGSGTVAGQKVLLLKPQTFMNLSGQALLRATDYYQVPPERVLVLADDVALAPGLIRVRLSGSAGGHNGFKSIITFLGQNFPRVRIGVGNRPRDDFDMADWVLSRFTSEERAAIEARYDDVTEAAQLIFAGQAAKAMEQYNRAGKKKDTESPEKPKKTTRPDEKALK